MSHPPNTSYPGCCVFHRRGGEYAEATQSHPACASLSALPQRTLRLCGEKSACLNILIGLLLCLVHTTVNAQDPLRTAWLTNANRQAAVARIQPEVHSVTLHERTVEVRSAGISLYYLGPLQTPADHVERIRQLQFTLPRFPAPQQGAHQSVRPDVVGVFVNGVPIYNQFVAQSYQGQNLWHFDPIAASDDGTVVATGRPQAEQHPTAWGLLEKLMNDASGHSPIIGYAFDGYPIYGPWGVVQGKLQRMRSSYRLRQLKRRTTLPDGTQLTPAQVGPDVNAEFPLGSFVEDYEYVAGAGDLDEFNGRFCQTPEYPNGTYAYVLSTDGNGRLAFPYLLAGQYFGRITNEELTQAVCDSASNEPTHQHKTLQTQRRADLELQVRGNALAAGQPLRLSFQASNNKRPLRFLEYVHERPLHLLVVSDDLAEFEHIHPELVAGDRYEVTHTFKHGVRYRLYADFTPPGSPQRIETFELSLTGQSRAPLALVADKSLVKEQSGLQLQLSNQHPLRAGEDIEFSFAIRDAATGKTPEQLTPYLGAWAHFVLIDETKQSFMHAHPIEENATAKPAIHVHNESISLGPPPQTIRTITNFPTPGLYKLWAQFQLADRVITQPFVLRVGAASKQTITTTTIPRDAVRITLGTSGFAPTQLSLPAGKAVKLAVTRTTEPNCGNRIVFPSLGIAHNIAVGETVVIELPALAQGDLRFTCGMGMYKGVLVVQ